MKSALRKFLVQNAFCSIDKILSIIMLISTYF